MTEIFLTINGRNYTVACEEGQEEHLGRLAEYVKTRVEDLTESVGQIGDARLMLMVALLISDELSDAYTETATLRDEIEQKGDMSSSTPVSSALVADRLALGLEEMADRIESLAERLEGA
ncbi:MAG: cell division protein ZapA [Rhodospirillaceae bacterium]|jgi:cell division protein ZapA|nr:cell division protein ZapA [Rhodospirillaceae bacterium]MBT5664583.1 cell division protein ZapA [Rhodospirillaceae bacterium]MBT5810901.1 cell division protein ZapA [Rhodospirillaceae bacterium]